MDNRLLFGVFGTQNTGKSTFIADVVADTASRTDPSLRFHVANVDYRAKIESMGLKINRNGDERCQKVIFDTLCDNVVKAAFEGDGCRRVILDRTPLDAFVYTMWHKLYGTAVIGDDTIFDMWDRTVKSMGLFDCVMWIPLSRCGEIEVVDDKFRDTDLRYRSQIDEIFARCVSRLISGYEFTNICAMYGDRMDRVEKLKQLERDVAECKDAAAKHVVGALEALR